MRAFNEILIVAGGLLMLVSSLLGGKREIGITRFRSINLGKAVAVLGVLAISLGLFLIARDLIETF